MQGRIIRHHLDVLAGSLSVAAPRLTARNLFAAIVLCSATSVGPWTSTVFAHSVPSVDRVEIVVAGKGTVGAGGVRDLRGTSLEDVQARPRDGGFNDDPAVRALRQYSTQSIGDGDFRVEATVILEALDGKGAGIVFDGGLLELDVPEAAAVLAGSLFGGGRLALSETRPASFRVGAPVDISIVRQGREVLFSINEEPVGSIGMEGITFGRVGFDLAGGRMKVLACSVEGALEAVPMPRAVFTGADGDIDEYRDPTMASDGSRLLIAAVGVGVHADGSDRTFVALRSLAADGTLGESRAIEQANPALASLKPDLVVLGHDGKSWRLLVQENAPRRLANVIRQFRSEDGVRFEELDAIRLDTTVQLVPAPMQAEVGAAGKPMLRAGVTRVVEKDVRAGVLVSTDGAPWQLASLGEVAGCNPLLLEGGGAIVRDPKSLQRTVLGGAAPIEAAKFEGAPQAGAILLGEGSQLVLAQSDPVHPNMLRRMVSCDGGASWRRDTPVWGSPAGTANAVRCGSQVCVAFEGGDSARRQHILFIQIPLTNETARCPRDAARSDEKTAN